jgi:pyruvate/2-oxoglutarate dehydrogenase complex dihydrolipoamide acyltransferase (E2) component
MANETGDELRVPDLGDQVDAATLTRWLVAVGDHVAEGDPVAEVEAEKVNVEIPAPHALHVLELLAFVGERVAVGQAIARTRAS